MFFSYQMNVSGAIASKIRSAKIPEHDNQICLTKPLPENAAFIIDNVVYKEKIIPDMNNVVAEIPAGDQHGSEDVPAGWYFFYEVAEDGRIGKSIEGGKVPPYFSKSVGIPYQLPPGSAFFIENKILGLIRIPDKASPLLTINKKDIIEA